MSTEEFTICQLGEPQYISPIKDKLRGYEDGLEFARDDQRILQDISVQAGAQAAPASFERAGAREQIFFDAPRTRAAIVTCGGLCPGLNDVIRSLVMGLHYWYGVERVYGCSYGYEGLTRGADPAPRPLSVDDVDGIHTRGGTILGSSRGPQDVDEMIDVMSGLGVSILFCIGGDGTLRGAHAIATRAIERGVKLGVVGIPKTIDNDIDRVYRSFGFETAVEEARRVIGCAHVEAKGARGGVGLVKLMGRDSGFIAAHATLASGDVNYCLVPEVPLALDGPGGLLERLRARLRARRHAVIAVAEGAGQELLGEAQQIDASGNKLHADIGLFVKDAIARQFAQWGEPVSVKYFDPSYIIRSVPAIGSDNIFCADLARMAVHAAMAGKTDLLIGQWHGVFTHVPLTAVVGRRKKIDPSGSLWKAVLSTTGQPPRWKA